MVLTYWSDELNRYVTIPGATCELCGRDSRDAPAVGRTTNPNYAGYLLCADCVAHYDREPHGPLEAGAEQP